ncbi:MAG TPA: ThiF family adenylyltransferase [Solirubrobacteraceae bacterium]|jgi:molybdopterin/thiamine biosynthesis adenylyltransferase
MAGAATERPFFRGEYDDELYWARVRRNLGWLGETEEQWRANQEKLRDATIGIAGAGGIGGAALARLVRMGARHLRIADPEQFEASNVQRQLGASLDTLGRNKAEVTAEQAFALTRDCEIEVFPEGVTADTAEDFVEGCDIVCDQIEIYEIDAKYALHQAFRRSKTCHTVIAVATVGHGALVHKYHRDSTPIEDLYEIPEGVPMGPEWAMKLVEGQVPPGLLPSFPSKEAVYEWAVDRREVPIHGPSPATCEGVLVDRICKELMDLPGAAEIPVRPGYAFIDLFAWQAKIVQPDEA